MKRFSEGNAQSRHGNTQIAGTSLVPSYDAHMPTGRSDPYLMPYREAVRRFGPNFSATLWMSREAQQLRFDVLIELAELGAEHRDNPAGAVILDAGCATGDFAEHLIKRGVKFARYIGVDAVEQLIEVARQRDLPRCEFHVADLIHDHDLFAQYRADIVCISGTLNTMEEDTARHMVNAAFDAANPGGGVVFNFLSDRAAPKCMQRDIGPARRFDTIKWIDWALNKTSLVSFTQDYLDGHDATVMMRKPGNE